RQDVGAEPPWTDSRRPPCAAPPAAARLECDVTNTTADRCPRASPFHARAAAAYNRRYSGWRPQSLVFRQVSTIAGAPAFGRRLDPGPGRFSTTGDTRNA